MASLDGDWAEAKPANRAAYAFARKLTFEPHLLQDDDLNALKKYYTESQILEMLLSLAGNNAINRWKEGAGIPQSHSSSNFAKNATAPLPKDRVLPIETYLTPTSEKYTKAITKITPLQRDSQTGQPTTETIAQRPVLESREERDKALQAAARRTPRLPLIDEAKARTILAPRWADQPVPQWARLLVTFPNHGKSRVEAQLQAEEKGTLSPLLKAQVSWILARQDRAWYALAEAKQRLKQLGYSAEQIDQLDGDWASFSVKERALFTVAQQLAASPIVLTDAQVAKAIQQAGNQVVVELIHYTTMRAAFHRITEPAGLSAEEFFR